MIGSMRTPFFGLLSLVLLGSCGKPVPVHFHENHWQSLAPVAELAAREGGVTLILLDYHHDLGPGDSGDSYNWVGTLILSGAVRRVIWVSGRDLQPRQLRSRADWVNRKLSSDPPDYAERKRAALNCVDWPGLMELERKGFERPFVITLDLDILAIEPGSDPDRFLKEMTDFILRIRPDLATVCLSSPYQPNPADGWRWWTMTWAALGSGGELFLEPETETRLPESREETLAWLCWNKTRLLVDSGAGYLPPPDHYRRAPQDFWSAFREFPPRPGNSAAAVWMAPRQESLDRYRLLGREFPPGRLKQLAVRARKAVVASGASLSMGTEPLLIGGSGDRGVAVRLVSDGKERECLAYRTGVDDWIRFTESASRLALEDPRYPPVGAGELESLEIEVTVFGAFEPMGSPWDFVPGTDALLVVYPGGEALLQPSLAEERNLSAEQFVMTLLSKAGQDPGDPKHPSLRYLKAPAVSIRVPLRGRARKAAD